MDGGILLRKQGSATVHWYIFLLKSGQGLYGIVIAKKENICKQRWLQPTFLTIEQLVSKTESSGRAFNHI
jgi:hypothetical protein